MAIFSMFLSWKQDGNRIEVGNAMEIVGDNLQIFWKLEIVKKIYGYNMEITWNGENSPEPATLICYELWGVRDFILKVNKYSCTCMGPVLFEIMPRMMKSMIL